LERRFPICIQLTAGDRVFELPASFSERLHRRLHARLDKELELAEP
jgi:hypothetical protein